jgi:DDE superfamily endonuclease
MSRRKWSGSLERRNLSQQQDLFLNVIAQTLLQDDSDDKSDDGEMMGVLVQTLHASMVDLHERINGTLEDPTIVWGQKKTIEDFSDMECQINFRFRKDNLQDFADCLWPRILGFLQGHRESIVVSNRYTAPYETCFLLYLYKMHRPVRLRPECERCFGLKISHLSHMIRTFGNALYLVAHQYLTNPQIWRPYFANYAAISARKVPNFMNNCWGFIDATFRNICRPTIHQGAVYSGYKKMHGLKFQGIATPDGYMAVLLGPYSGRTHDAEIFRETELEQMLEQMMPFKQRHQNPVYHLCGDLAYPQSAYVCRGYAGAQPGTIEAIFNNRMSQGRITVEWAFKEIISLWAHLDCH